MSQSLNLTSASVSVLPLGAPSHAAASAAGRSSGASRWNMGAALGAALMVVGCASPGMKLDVKPGARPTTTQVNGLNVTLQALDPQAAPMRAARTTDPATLSALLVDKVPPYRVGPQDVLLITVWDHPEITLPLGQFRTDAATGMVIDEDGFLYFPYVGKIQISGQTISQVRDTITSHLAKVLQKPQVDVKVVAYRSQKIYVGGEVKNPAVYNVTDVPFTLAEAVNRAGGFLPTADDSRLVLTRGDKSWRLDFQSLLGAGNRIGQILLKDGDSLHVPNSLEEPIYLMGELVKPGTLPLTHGNLSLAKAISDAGGILGASADARSIYVIRQGTAANAVDVFHLDARNPTAMVLADHFALNPRDIVYVDAGTLVRFNRVMNLLAPSISAVTSTALTAAEVRYSFKK
ncbi:polysaccharide biosynthesis/export family protein [Geothrix sp. PMB-07]|uniref:polysaccharide biosynthesis/export family protein n=1 Tax=Geothrix sp. PMB-07 TaxID=3068640 RepID=UPI002742153B|nr:polysaccharide biosynthesis/export family protein [Geothrix sp. PMB-07]WLT30001.1 polysaccharide biosynthesis/export family protein [Geothrix sp. PMB-07]